MEKSSLTQEEAVELLREYFMNTREERTAAIAERNAKEDSIRLASGDTTQVVRVAADPEMFASEEEREELSYAFGVDIGTNVKNSGLPIQLYWLNKGMLETHEGNAAVTEDKVNEFLQNYFMVVRPQQIAEQSAAWLAKVEKKSGVKKTESGLLYKVVKEGDVSRSATDDRDEVTVHYTGRDRDGEVFDSSIFENMPAQRQEMMRQYQPDAFDEKGNIIENEPVTFPLNRVIAGWTEGMKLVGPGGKIILYIPAELAYGARGNQAIAPNAALEFEVELIDVKPFEEPKAEEKTEAAE
jgi:FKBP-type peptidyl-prolyl cis-trans isomerase FkpA